MMNQSKLRPFRVAIAWKWLPFYAASSIGALPKQDPRYQLKLYGTRSARPFNNLEEVAGRSIHWLPENRELDWGDFAEDPPDLLILSGWKEKSFLSLAKAIKRHSGKCVVMVDNRWRGDWRQRLGVVYYRLYLSRLFDGAWVPGESGKRFLKSLGVKDDRLWEGLYGADPTRFLPTSTLRERPKRFLYVGAFLKRKGIELFLEAWPIFYKQFPDWELELVGNNEPDLRLRELDGVVLNGFVQPERLPGRLQNARCLLLPSFDENWGVVVHEAICCGCGVIVSSAVGSAADLVGEYNGRIFKSASSGDLLKKMVDFASLQPDELDKVYDENLQVREKFGPKRWAQEFLNIIETFSNGR